MADQVPAHIIAAVDQHTARLRDLVNLARRHAEHCSVEVAPCAGAVVLARLRDMECHDQLGLIALAVAELAALGYGQPPAPLALTDAAHAALDIPPSTQE